MKRKEIRERDKPGFWPIVILIAIVVIGSGVFYGTVYGASYNHPISVTQDPRHDSTLIVVYSDSANEYDSTVAYEDTLLILNDIYNYTITEIDFWDGQPGYGYDDAPTVLRQAYSTGAGGGLNAVTHYIVDTIKGAGGTPDTVSGVVVEIQTMTGSRHAGGTTNSNGYISYNAPSDSFLVLASKFTYVFLLDTIVVSGIDTFSTDGYQDIPTITPPSNSDLCNVNGYIYDASYNIIQYAKVYFDAGEIEDTCGNVNIPKGEYFDETDDTGYFTKELLNTDCMKGTSVWKVHFEYTDKNGLDIISKTVRIEIPADSTTYRLVF